MSKNRLNLVGLKFGRWTVLSDATDEPQWKPKTPKARTSRWNCVCECGTLRAVKGDSLRSGKSVSCGCFARELASVIAAGMVRRVYSEEQSIQRRKQAKSRCKKKMSAELTDSYVRQAIRHQTSIPGDAIPSALVEIKREQLRLLRLAKSIKQEAAKQLKDKKS